MKATNMFHLTAKEYAGFPLTPPCARNLDQKMLKNSTPNNFKEVPLLDLEKVFFEVLFGVL